MAKPKHVATVLALVGASLLGGVTSARLWNGSNIVDGSLTGIDIQDESLTGTDIENGSIEPADLATPSAGGPDRILEYVTQPRTYSSTAQNWTTIPVDERSFQVPTDGFYSVMHDSAFSHDVDLCENGEGTVTQLSVDGEDAGADMAQDGAESVKAGESLFYLTEGSHEISIRASFSCGAGGDEWSGEVALTVEASRVAIVKR